MSRYKIATKTDTLRYKIAKEVFGEIEDSEGVRDIPSWEIFEKCLEQHKRIAELEDQLKNAIMPKFKIGDYFIEYWDKEPSIYKYQGIKHFKCLNKKQGYHCDYVILGALLLEEDFIKQITKEEAEAKLKELGESSGKALEINNNRTRP